MDFLIGFVLGFAAATGATIAWYHGSLKPKIQSLMEIAEHKLKGE